MKFIVIVLILSLMPVFAQDISPLKATLEKQAAYQSVEVRFRQTKKSPALTSAVKSSGKLWMVPGKSFRWETQQPKSSLAVYDGKQVFLIDERKKSGVVVSPKDKRAKPLLLMLGMGEGRSTAELLKHFKVTGTNQVEEHSIVSLKPKRGAIRKHLKALVMQVNQKTNFMERIEWTQRDGTVIVTEFYPPQVNKPLPSGVFTVNTSAYTWEKAK